MLSFWQRCHIVYLLMRAVVQDEKYWMPIERLWQADNILADRLTCRTIQRENPIHHHRKGDLQAPPHFYLFSWESAIEAFVGLVM